MNHFEIFNLIFILINYRIRIYLFCFIPCCIISIQSRSKYKELFKIYNALHPFDYEQDECPKDIKEKIDSYIGSIYIGQLSSRTSKREGVGIYVDSFGCIIEGYWKEDQLNGRGRAIWFDGEYYIGNWLNGKYQGQGEEHCSDGDVYIGQFENCKREGHGKLVEADRTEYIGQFEKDMLNGQVTQINPDGTEIEGLWINNEYTD